MKISCIHRSLRAQTSIEYLLLLAVVAVIVISSFTKGSLIDQVRNTSQTYYSSVTRVIMGENPKAINGQWCPATCPSGPNGPSVVYLACDCPAPAFGGAFCTGPNSISCSGSGGGSAPCVPGTCTATYQCGSTLGTNNCGPCTATAGQCPIGQSCNTSYKCV